MGPNASLDSRITVDQTVVGFGWCLPLGILLLVELIIRGPQFIQQVLDWLWPTIRLFFFERKKTVRMNFFLKEKIHTVGAVVVGAGKQTAL